MTQLSMRWTKAMKNGVLWKGPALNLLVKFAYSVALTHMEARGGSYLAFHTVPYSREYD